MKRKTNGLRCKKANVLLEGILILIILFIFSIISIFAVKFLGEINADIQAQTDLSNSSKAMMQEITNYSPNLLNNLFLIALILLWIAVLVFAFLIDTQPVFFVISIILLAILLLLGMMLGNVYNDITTGSELSTVSANFNYSNWVFSHIHLVALFMGASIILVLYGKNKAIGGGL